VLRVGKITKVEPQPAEFVAPADLDPLAAVEEHLAMGWRYAIEVEIDAPLDQAAEWIRRSMGRLEAIDENRTRLLASTDEPDWYAAQLSAIHAPFRIIGGPELQAACRALADRLHTASEPAAR